MPALDFIVAIVAGIVIWFLGLFTFTKNPKSATNRFFFLFTITLATYNIVNYFSLHQNDLGTTLLLIRTTMSLAALLNLFFYLLTVSFPDPKLLLRRRWLWLAIVATGLMIPLTLSPFLFSSVTVKGTNIEPVAAPGMALFLLHTLVYMGGGAITLFKKFRKSSGIAKTQLRLFFLGAGIMFFSIIVTNLIFVFVFNTSSFVGLLPLYTLLFVGFLSYAIVRHRFLDIGVLVARTVTFTILITFVALCYSLFLFLISRIILDIHFTPQEQVTLFILTVFITMSFQWTRRFVERVTDRYFFHGKYSTNDILSQLSHVMASTIRLEEMSHGILQIILKELRVTQGAIILFNDGLVADVKSEGYTTPPTLDEAEIKTISDTLPMLIFDELAEETTKVILRKLNISILIHLRTEGKQIGILALGPKASGDIYSEQDLALLEILAPEAAVAIQNAFAYEEIRRFNITLREEIARATDDLRQANEQLKQLDKLKDEFVSLASHELRTPMTAIKSYTWMVLNGKTGPLEPKAHEYLDRVYQSTDRLLHMVNEMLDISRIESGRVQIHPESFDMTKLASDVQTEFFARATERQLTLTVLTPNPLPQIACDREKIHQVLENIIGNAFKFTPAGGSVTVTMTSPDSNLIKVEVHDTGPGIKPEDIDKLFKKFSRLDNNLVVNTGAGTGLGLFICKQYVEIHSGTIGVESTYGQGTTFWFSLPVAFTINPNMVATITPTLQNGTPAVDLKKA